VSDGDPGSPSFTEDRLLGGRVRVRQPADGYRAAIDPVFLAAAVAVEPQQLVLDVGCGPGAAMLCLAARVPECRVVGLEMQRDLVRLAGDNAILNAMETRVSVMIGDLLHPPPRLSPGAFDHVMANPPFIIRRQPSQFLCDVLIKNGIEAFGANTPQVEKNLYSAGQCVFVSFGSSIGQPQYGNVLMTFTKEHLTGGWVAPHSGYYYASLHRLGFTPAKVEIAHEAMHERSIVPVSFLPDTADLALPD